MQFKTDHNFYAPIFKQLAELLKKDYEIKYDSSDNPLGISATVIHKKYKHHGFHISTYLGENPEWHITCYVNLPIEDYVDTKSNNFIYVDFPSYKFKPELKDKNNYDFPILSDNQIQTLKTKFVEFNKEIIRAIKHQGKNIDEGSLIVSTDMIEQRINFDYLTGFDNYGVKCNYRNFLLYNFKNERRFFKVIENIFNSTTPEIRNLLNEAIEKYINHATLLDKIEDAVYMIKLFSTRSNIKILQEFNDNHINLLKEFLISHFKSADEGYDSSFDFPTLRSYLRIFDDHKKIYDELHLYAFNHTKEMGLLNDSVKDLFLF